MQKENKTEKNSIVEIKRKDIKEWEYVPQKSYGPFKIGDRISKYLEMMEYNFGYIYYKKTKRKYSFNNYDIPLLGIALWVDYGKITTIRFSKKFMYKGYNLIKMDYFLFIELFNVVPDDIDYKLPVEQANGRYKWQDVYAFYGLGLQLWVWRGKIVTVLADGD